MLEQFLLDQVRPEAGTVADLEMAIHDLERVRHQVVAPRRVVDVKLTNEKVGHCGAHVGRDQGGEAG